MTDVFGQQQVELFATEQVSTTMFVCVRTDVPGDTSSRINLRKLRSVSERKGEAVIELNGSVPF
jgi:hypothetical protein